MSITFRSCCFLVFIVLAVSSEEIDKKTKCKGPIRHYEDLHCKPIYEEGQSCAIRYDCSHLYNRKIDKCYANGNEYAINEKIKKEDRPTDCDGECSCFDGNVPGVAEIICAAIDCQYPSYVKGEKNCYVRREPGECCGTKVCPKDDTEIKTKCEVEGKIYMDGQEFYPESDPDMVCYCMEGYKGKNVAPFCKKISCGTEMRHSEDLRGNCAPVFYDTQSPQNSCGVTYRCQNDKDAVVQSENKKPDDQLTKEIRVDMMCKFGNLTMDIGDELNQATDYSSVCVKCVCEVPPTPTCQRLPDSECDVTKHPKFD